VSGRFGVGDRVLVKREQPDGNPRTPRYVRGKRGVIAELHGVIPNPLDHRGLYPPLYTVMFDLKELFGTTGDGKLCVDIHEEWLEPA
jgi:nitrile hydratase